MTEIANAKPLRCYLLSAFLALLTFPAVADITGKARVIDGNTIDIAGERIRLHGIDAPESKQTCTDKDGKEWRCGQDVTFALAEMIGNHWITCKGEERGKFGRLIAVCYAGPYDLNAKMVRQGWALAYRRYSTDYVQDERAAKVAQKGIWRGEFMPPWEWRSIRQVKKSGTTAAPPPAGSSGDQTGRCCKVCVKGKPCGNICIAMSTTCRQPQGCAC